MNFGYSNGFPMNQNYMGQQGQQNNPEMGIGIKILYGVLSGSQSLLNLLGSFVDIAFFIRQVKGIVLNILIYLIKRIFRLVKYLVTLRWIIDIMSSSGLLAKKILLSTSYYNSLITLIKLLSIECKINKIIYSVYNSFNNQNLEI